MTIQRIRLSDFRNYERAIIEPCEGVTVLTGENAQGKTNVLEAVYLACTGRSHRTAREAEMIRNGADVAHIAIDAKRVDGVHDVTIELSRLGRRKITVFGKPVARSGQLLGHVTGVLFSPEDLRMVKDGPAERRRFVDMELSQLKPAYYYALQKYNRALKQRAAVLRMANRAPSAAAMLDVWDSALAEAGAVIMAMRRCFIADLSREAGETHRDISGARETLTVEYHPSITTSDDTAHDLLQALHAARPTDLRRMVTSVGPHRDDVMLRLNGLDVRAYGSQGQQRTCALSLKLAELGVMQQVTGEPPLLMLDDVMSELDPTRRRLLLGRIAHVQTFVTCTDPEDLAGATVGRTYQVRAASLALHP